MRYQVLPLLITIALVAGVTLVVFPVIAASTDPSSTSVAFGAAAEAVLEMVGFVLATFLLVLYLTVGRRLLIYAATRPRGESQPVDPVEQATERYVAGETDLFELEDELEGAIEIDAEGWSR